MEPPDAIRMDGVIDRVAARAPGHAALIFGDRRWTYGELRAEMDRRAALLVDAGMRPGDVLATTERPGDLMALAFLACCRADVTLFPLSSRLAVAEQAALFACARPRAVLSADGRPHLALPTVAALPLSPAGSPSLAAVVEVARRSASGGVDATVIILTTSGTTGSGPKLIEIAHRTLTWRWQRESWWERSSDVIYLAYGAAPVVRPLCEALLHGATVVYAGRQEPGRMEAEMAAAGVTALRTVPTVLRMLAEQRQPPPANLAVRLVYNTAAPLAADVQRAIAARYDATVIQRYSSNEGDTMMLPPPSGAPPGSVGMPIPGVAVRLVDDTGRAVADGTPGALLARSPGVMKGYLDDPAATAAALADGWLRTGDLVYRDVDGFYFLAGRPSLRINVGGLKVAPEEVEAVLAAHPAIREVVVLGMPDAARGEVVRAVLVPHGEAPSAHELRAFCRARLAGYKVPRRFEFRDELPRSPLGKVLRQQL